MAPTFLGAEGGGCECDDTRVPTFLLSEPRVGMVPMETPAKQILNFRRCMWQSHGHVVQCFRIRIQYNTDPVARPNPDPHGKKLDKKISYKKKHVFWTMIYAQIKEQHFLLKKVLRISTPDFSLIFTSGTGLISTFLTYWILPRTSRRSGFKTLP